MHCPAFKKEHGDNGKLTIFFSISTIDGGASTSTSITKMTSIKLSISTFDDTFLRPCWRGGMERRHSPNRLVLASLWSVLAMANLGPLKSTVDRISSNCHGWAHRKAWPWGRTCSVVITVWLSVSQTYIVAVVGHFIFICCILLVQVVLFFVRG